MDNKTEQRIIAQILAGKSDEFAYFLDTYGQQVFALIARMTDSDEDAEELTQDTFMKAYEHLHQFNGGSSFSTWLYRIAYNTTLSALRKRQVETTVVSDRLWQNLEDTQVDSALDDSSEERIEALQRALRQLPPDERALVSLFYEEERSIGEIAGILGQTESNVKVRLHRLRKKLYVLMEKEEKL